MSVAFNLDSFRGEVMGILGNLQVAPEAYRERGFSAFLEWAPSPRLALGVSGLLGRSQRDVLLREELLRQAYGAHVRYAPSSALALMGEVNALVENTGRGTVFGYVGLLQADWEVVQGLHLVATAEALDEGRQRRVPSVGGWASVVWYLAPHTDLRLDVIQRRLIGAQQGEATNLTTGLLQLHFFL